jgi:hypothetical protein
MKQNTIKKGWPKAWFVLPFYLLAILPLLTACSDNDYQEDFKSNPGQEALALKASQTTLVLAEENHADEAIAFAWTTGHNFQTGNRISYTLTLLPEGADAGKAYKLVDNEHQVYTQALTVEQLNDLLIKTFLCEAGQSVNLQAVLTATVPGVSEVQKSVVTIAVTSYQPVTEHLYIIGSAAPNGWSADQASEMARADNGVFQWTGQLFKGELKFITTQGKFLPSYNNDGNGGLTYRTSDDEPDEKFIIEETYRYIVKVNLLAGTVSFQKTEGGDDSFSNVYFVGDATSWLFEPMWKDPLDGYLFRYARFFSTADAGQFKFGASTQWSNMFFATDFDMPYTEEAAEYVENTDGHPDRKWKLEAADCDKAYKICLDTRVAAPRMMMTVFTPYTAMYLVGDAAPCGWDISNATPMTAVDEWTFTWTGMLNAGELKFSCDKNNSWMGAWFLCARGNGVAPSGQVEKMLFVDKSSSSFKKQYLEVNVDDIDQKWKISQKGTYTITLNQLEETVSIVKN